MKTGSPNAAPSENPNFRRPSMLEALGEFRVGLEATMLWLNAITYPWPHAIPGQGKTVMFIPGFMAGDITLAPLANFCRYLGHRSVMSGIWSNSRCPREVLELVGTRLERVVERHGGPVVMIGHSLGGIYAREIGRRYPEFVERVITMGSPITRARDAANTAVQVVANSVAMLRGRAEGCLSENCSCGVGLTMGFPPRVPTSVIYSRTDGIVHFESCIDRSGLATVENVEVHCSHVGMAVSAEVYKIIAARLLLPTPEAHAANGHARSHLHLHPGAEADI